MAQNKLRWTAQQSGESTSIGVYENTISTIIANMGVLLKM